MLRQAPFGAQGGLLAVGNHRFQRRSRGLCVNRNELFIFSGSKGQYLTFFAGIQSTAVEFATGNLHSQAAYSSYPQDYPSHHSKKKHDVTWEDLEKGKQKMVSSYTEKEERYLCLSRMEVMGILY